MCACVLCVRDCCTGLFPALREPLQSHSHEDKSHLQAHLPSPTRIKPTRRDRVPDPKRDQVKQDGVPPAREDGNAKSAPRRAQRARSRRSSFPIPNRRTIRQAHTRHGDIVGNNDAVFSGNFSGVTFNGERVPDGTYDGTHVPASSSSTSAGRASPNNLGHSTQIGQSVFMHGNMGSSTQGSNIVVGGNNVTVNGRTRHTGPGGYVELNEPGAQGRVYTGN